MKKTLFALLLVLLTVTSCNLARRVPKPRQAAEADKSLTAADVTAMIHKAEPDYRTINISKCDLTVRFGDGTFTLRASARIIRDSLISISIQPMLGIEVARVEFTPGYFYVYDKMNKAYSETPYDYLHIATGLPIDYNAIQSMLTARLFTLGGREERYRLDDATDSTYVLISREATADMYQYYEADINSQLLTVSGLMRSKMLPYSATYGDYRTVKRHVFPYDINIEVDFKKLYVKAHVAVEKIVFDEEIRNPVINTERYKRIPFNNFFTE